MISPSVLEIRLRDELVGQIVALRSALRRYRTLFGGWSSRLRWATRICISELVCDLSGWANAIAGAGIRHLA